MEGVHRRWWDFENPNQDWSQEVIDFQIALDEAGYPEGSPEDPFGVGVHPTLANWQIADLPEFVYFCGGYLKNQPPALHTCKSESLGPATIIELTFFTQNRSRWKLFN